MIQYPDQTLLNSAIAIGVFVTLVALVCLAKLAIECLRNIGGKKK